jgi:hypothetical protein
MGKIKESFNVSDWEVSTNTGWTGINQVHLIEDDIVYKISTSNYTIKCADKHILFDNKYNSVFAKDIKLNDFIVTQAGPEAVTQIEVDSTPEPMYDLSVDGERYIANGILNHNTTVVGIFGLHYSMFNKDKTVAIMANKMQGAIEIMDRVKVLLEGLPPFLKPGIKEYNKKSITFENGCKMIAAATSPSAVRGLAINCMTGDNEVTIQDQDTGEVFNIPLSELGTKMAIDFKKEKENEKL